MVLGPLNYISDLHGVVKGNIECVKLPTDGIKPQTNPAYEHTERMQCHRNIAYEAAVIPRDTQEYITISWIADNELYIKSSSSSGQVCIFNRVNFLDTLQSFSFALAHKKTISTPQ